MEQLSLTEFQARFGERTERRQELLERFTTWLRVARDTGDLRHVWIYGIYLTGKPGPDDIDAIALFRSDFDPAALPPSVRHWFQLDALEDIYAIHLTLFTERMPHDILAGLMEWLAGDDYGNINMVEVIP